MSFKQSKTNRHLTVVSGLLVLVCVLLAVFGSPRASGKGAKSDNSVAPEATTATQCLSGTLTASDPAFDHPENATATCNSLVSPSRRDHYLLTVTGCATFPTSVTLTTDGAAGCAHPAFGTGAQCVAGTAGINDTTISVYRKGGATAGTASGSGFSGDPADTCGTTSVPQRLVGFGDDISGANTLSTVTLSLGPGDYDVVVTGFSDLGSCEGRGTYNLSVTAASAGCTLTQQPTASDGLVRGRITDSNGAPISGSVVSLNGTQNRKLITDSNGNYVFDNVETNGFYTVRPARANFDFSPAERSFSQLGNGTDAAFTAISSGGFVNPIDTPEYFVRQHYLDFLNREPDESGFNFWSDQILECGNDNACIERRTINVSAAYFLSTEFQQTGGLVDKLYRASYGRQPQFAEFMPDTRTVAQNVIVGRASWAQQLETNKQAFVDAFVNRPAFIGVYGNMDNNAYVDTLISHTGVTFTSGERDALVNGLIAKTMTRANVLRSIAENQSFVNAKLNETFVMMEYFGYLRRDPDASGYAFWLNKLNQFGGNFERAEMVKAFNVSGEYRDRFQQ